MKATDVDALNNGGRTLDGHVTIRMKLDNLEGTLLDGELTLNIKMTDVDKVINVIVMGDARAIFTVVVGNGLTMAAFRDVFPAGEVGGMDYHVTAKNDLAGGCSKSGVVRCTHAKSDVLEQRVDLSLIHI